MVDYPESFRLIFDAESLKCYSLVILTVMNSILSIQDFSLSLGVGDMANPVLDNITLDIAIFTFNFTAIASGPHQMVLLTVKLLSI